MTSTGYFFSRRCIILFSKWKHVELQTQMERLAQTLWHWLVTRLIYLSTTQGCSTKYQLTKSQILVRWYQWFTSFNHMLQPHVRHNAHPKLVHKVSRMLFLLVDKNLALGFLPSWVSIKKDYTQLPFYPVDAFMLMLFWNFLIKI